MIHLLDVNLLIAILDPFHVHHERAHAWLGTEGSRKSWASCPLTENAFVRIVGASTYPNSPGSIAATRELLARNCDQKEHHFWADAISLCQRDLWGEWSTMKSSQITDVYLLALAVKNGGKLTSFDRRIPAHLIREGKESLLVLAT
jgi:toxin-antitoxin system PIN domain toxin